MANFNVIITDQTPHGIIGWLRTVLAPRLNNQLSLGMFVGGVPQAGNFGGALLEQTVTTANLGTQITVTHNLNAALGGTNFPNVSWLVLGVRTVGASQGTVASGSTADVFYDNGTITKNSIQLKFTSSVNAVGGSLIFRLVFLPTGA